MEFKLARSIPEFCRATDVGRSKIYEEIKAGRLKAKKFGSRTIIIDEDGRAWLEALPEAVPSEKDSPAAA